MFGCVYINEAQIRTVNGNQCEVDVLPVFSSFASQWTSDLYVFGL